MGQPEGLFLTPLQIEAVSGFGAGIVQATLNTPLYNFKFQQLRRTSAEYRRVGGVLKAAQLMYQRSGIRSFYQNYHYVFAQESCALALFFGSYELLKTHLTEAMRKHVD